MSVFVAKYDVSPFSDRFSFSLPQLHGIRQPYIQQQRQRDFPHLPMTQDRFEIGHVHKNIRCRCFNYLFDHSLHQLDMFRIKTSSRSLPMIV